MAPRIFFYAYNAQKKGGNIMFKKFKEHMKQPLTFGWYYKTCAISAILSAVLYGVICLIGYINSQKGEDDEEIG